MSNDEIYASYKEEMDKNAVWRGKETKAFVEWKESKGITTEIEETESTEEEIVEEVEVTEEEEVVAEEETVEEVEVTEEEVSVDENEVKKSDSEKKKTPKKESKAKSEKKPVLRDENGKKILSKKEKSEKRKKKLMKSPKIKRIVEDAQNIDNIDRIKESRDSHNNVTHNLINRLKKIQSEIGDLHDQAKTYRDKRNNLNKSVQQIKKDKVTNIEQLNVARQDLRDKKKKTSKKPATEEKKGVKSIRDLKHLIEKNERRIETEDLSLNEENRIVEEIEEYEAELQKALQSRPKQQFRESIDQIKGAKESLSGIYTELSEKAEESQNYHLLYLDISKEINDLRKEKRNLQKDLNENRFVADIYHERLMELNSKDRTIKKLSYNSKFKNKTRMKKEIKKMNLQDAKLKMKSGGKLNIFEARAYLESQANKN